MRWEDAQLCLLLEPAFAGRPDAVDCCRGGIASGVDIIGVTSGGGDPALWAGIRQVCREEDALFVAPAAEWAQALAADGLHVAPNEGSLGQLRYQAGQDIRLGYDTRTLNDLMLALELGVDFVFHDAGAATADMVRSARTGYSTPVFAAGLMDPVTARERVESGLFRLCVGPLPEVAGLDKNMAAYARLLGREI